MHDLATKLAEAGVNIKAIQELCGHSSDVTLDIYATATKELKQREFGNFEERMKQQKLEWEKELVIKQKMRGVIPLILLYPQRKSFSDTMAFTGIYGGRIRQNLTSRV